MFELFAGSGTYGDVDGIGTEASFLLGTDLLGGSPLTILESGTGGVTPFPNVSASEQVRSIDTATAEVRLLFEGLMEPVTRDTTYNQGWYGSVTGLCDGPPGSWFLADTRYANNFTAMTVPEWTALPFRASSLNSPVTFSLVNKTTGIVTKVYEEDTGGVPETQNGPGPAGLVPAPSGEFLAFSSTMQRCWKFDSSAAFIESVNSATALTAALGGPTAIGASAVRSAPGEADLWVTGYYFLGGYYGFLARINGGPLGTADVIPGAWGDFGSGLAVTANYVFVASGLGAVHRYDRASGQIDLIGSVAEPPEGTRIVCAVQGSYLYVLSGPSLYRIPINVGRGWVVGRIAF